MTTGMTTVNQSPYYGQNEAILYRTRTEILTDKRILLDGTAYAFNEIDAVDVVRLKHYIPFQIARLLGLIGTLILVWYAFGSFRDSALISMLIYGVMAIVLAMSTFLSSAVVPSHAIRLTLSGETVYMMHDVDVSYLNQVNEAILREMRRNRR